MLMGTRLLKRASARLMKGSGVIAHEEACLCERTYLLLLYISFCMIFFLQCVSSFVAVSVLCMCMESGKCTSANMISTKRNVKIKANRTQIIMKLSGKSFHMNVKLFFFFYVLQLLF